MKNNIKIINKSVIKMVCHYLKKNYFEEKKEPSLNIVHPWEDITVDYNLDDYIDFLNLSYDIYDYPELYICISSLYEIILLQDLTIDIIDFIFQDKEETDELLELKFKIIYQ